MAEGGYDPMDTPTEETPLIPDTGDDDDDTNPWDNPDQYQVTDEGEVMPTDSTQPFEPGAASTPAGGTSAYVHKDTAPPRTTRASHRRKPLSLQGILKASVCDPRGKKWHGVRLATSSHWPTQANLICGTRWPQIPFQGS